jgi:Pentapeptide repeats (8 copies)
LSPIERFTGPLGVATRSVIFPPLIVVSATGQKNVGQKNVGQKNVGQKNVGQKNVGQKNNISYFSV